MAEIHAIVCVAIAAIKLGDTCRHNTRKSNSLIRCLQAVKTPLESIDRAEHDRIQVSHEETLGLLKDVIERAHALLEKQTKAQNSVLKTLRSPNVRDQFHEIQIDLQAHLQTLTLSVGVLSGVQIQKMQVGLDVVKEVNREALEEHLIELRKNQGAMQGNQLNILENQNTTHDNQRSMLSKAEVALRNQDEMKSMLTSLVQMSGNVVSNNTYITNDHSTTTTNNINNVTNNYQDQRSNVLDSDYSRATKPRKPEPYVKRKTKLHIAAEKGSLSEVEVALRECFIDHETPTGSTALLLAVENNHVEVVKELLSAGVDFTVEANQKAWMEVFEREQSESPEREHLIPHFSGAGADIKSLSDRSPCILLLAVENNYTEVIKELLLIGVDFTVEANQKAWMHVIEKKDVHLIPHFADGGVDVNGKYWEPFLLKARFEEGHLEVVRALIEAGAEVNAKMTDDLTSLLLLSAEKGHLEIVRALIEAGADVNAKSYDWTPLLVSARNGQLEVARYLIEALADVTAKDSNGWTPLHSSAWDGHLEITRALIEARGCGFIVNVNAKDNAGMTPLHRSAFEGRLGVARELIKAGADVNAEEKYGSTPLHFSAGHLEVARALIEAGADVNAKCKYGSTPLHLSAGHLEVARALIEAGADVNAMNKYGRTPLYICASNGHLEVARALINAGSTSDGLSNEQFADLLRKISGLATK